MNIANCRAGERAPRISPVGGWRVLGWMERMNEKRKWKVVLPELDREIEVADGATLMDAMIVAGISIDAPCGGHGSCRKCAVEMRGAGEDAWRRVLACQTQVRGDVQLRAIDGAEGLRVLQRGARRDDAPWSPWVRAEKLRLPPALAGERASLWTRLERALAESMGARTWRGAPEVVGELARMSNGGAVDAWATISAAGEVLELSREEPEIYMAAFDLGTTSIAGYLLDARRRCVRTEGALNPQVRFGADVISRIDYALNHGVQALADCARGAVEELLSRLCAGAGVARERVCAVSLVGNTAMHHLFLGISPEPLARTPYCPAVEEAMRLKARDFGLQTHENADLLVLPVIAGYVGADTVACMLSGDWLERRRRTLLIDIGTNGELVMGDCARRVACSTAAGPAFEGARIQCGMRGVPGAVDRVWLEGDELRWHVIGDGAAKGLCGSGLVDWIAALLRRGEIDESGRFSEGDSRRLGDTQVALTQRDVREVQLAKAAICAGIRLMAEHLQISLSEIEEVHIAGAFGNYLNADSTCAIGLIPAALQQKIVKVGNAAGEGAKRVLQDHSCWDSARELADGTEFLELANVRAFQEAFVDALEFPDEEDGDGV